jgi:regulator of protease activity HflC (stomatin/prohibitin superfamily)
MGNLFPAAPIAASIILLVVVLLSVRIAVEYQRAVVFRLGRFVGERGPGLYFLIRCLNARSRSTFAWSPRASRSRRQSQRTMCPSRSMPWSGTGSSIRGGDSGGPYSASQSSG